MQASPSTFLGRGLAYPFRFSRITGGTALSATEAANAAKVKAGIKMIFDTRKGERFMKRWFGSNFHRFRFENNTSILRGLLLDEAKDAIRQEPRVQLLSVTLDDTEIENNRIDVIVEYKIIASQVVDNLVWPFYKEEGAA